MWGCWGLPSWQRWANHLQLPGPTLGRWSRSQRSHNVNWLGAIGCRARSERQDLFAGVRKLGSEQRQQHKLQQNKNFLNFRPAVFNMSPEKLVHVQVPVWFYCYYNFWTSMQPLFDHNILIDRFSLTPQINNFFIWSASRLFPGSPTFLSLYAIISKCMVDFHALLCR